MRTKIIKGGVSLVLKQILSALLSLVSTLLIARILGPEKYGIVAISLGIFYFFTFIGRMGLNVYVIRQPNISKEEVEQILGFYNTVGASICLLLWLAAPVFGWWTGKTEVSLALRFLFPVVWLDMIGSCASSMLERELNFTKVSLVNALSEVANYMLSVTLVLIYKSYLAVILGYVLQYLVFALLAHYFSPIRWRYRWNSKTLTPALKYSFSYCSSNWILNLRSLTIPLLVSRLAGVEAAGIANVAFRVVEKLLLLRNVIRNMSISIMAKLMGDPNAVKRALDRGMLYQALLMGFICAAFSGFASWIIPTMFGDEWLLSAKIFPLIGLSVIIGALFDLHSALLYASGHNTEVGRFHIGYVASLWIGCLCLIPPFGIWGYGVGEIITLPSYYLIHRSLVKYYKSPNYWPVFWSILAAIPPLFGGIWLEPLPNLALMIASYGILFICCSTVRKTSIELSRNFFSKSTEKSR